MNDEQVEHKPIFKPLHHIIKYLPYEQTTIEVGFLILHLKHRPTSFST